MSRRSARNAFLSGICRVKERQDREIGNGNFGEALGFNSSVFPEGGFPRPALYTEQGRVWVFDNATRPRADV